MINLLLKRYFDIIFGDFFADFHNARLVGGFNPSEKY